MNCSKPLLIRDYKLHQCDLSKDPTSEADSQNSMIVTWLN